jgi:hypothetical protein
MNQLSNLFIIYSNFKFFFKTKIQNKTIKIKLIFFSLKIKFNLHILFATLMKKFVLL